MALMRNVATVGGYTMVSRIFGFIRDAVTAAALGAGPASDAFVVALRLPNLFRALFAEGAFSAAFVPIFARMVEAEGETAAKAFAERALAVLLWALLTLVTLAEFFMPQVIPAIASGFGNSSAEFELATHLTRITFPYLLFICLVALQGGILNSLNKFGAVAFTPVLLNLFMIAGVAVTWRSGSQGTDAAQGGRVANALCWSVTLAGVAQFLWLMHSCRHAGMALRLPWLSFGPEIRRFLRLMGPSVFGAGVTQLNLMVSTNVASHLPRGSITYLYYADRLNQLPLAVIGIAIGTSILPPLSRALRAGDEAGANETQNRGLELALLLTVPAAFALAITADPILAVLFQRGRFDAAAVAATAAALGAYAFGLPAFVAIKVLAPAFFARHDTSTPVKVGMVAVAVNFGLTLTLWIPFAHVGNALATTAAGWVNALALGWLLHRMGHFSVDRRARERVPRILAASLVMAVVLAGLQRTLHGALYDAPETIRVAALMTLVASGLACYAGAALALGAGSWADVKRLLRRRTA